MATGATGFQGFMRDHAKEFSLFGNGVSLAGGALVRPEPVSGRESSESGRTGNGG